MKEFRVDSEMTHFGARTMGGKKRYFTAPISLLLSTADPHRGSLCCLKRDVNMERIKYRTFISNLR